MAENELKKKIARAMWNLRPAFKASVITHASRWEREDFPCDDIEPRKYFLENADVALAAIREAGFEVVPREPTEKMLEAGYPCFAGVACGDLALDIAGDAYHAMLSASPLKGET
jgi:hypothetical protein